MYMIDLDAVMWYHSFTSSKHIGDNMANKIIAITVIAVLAIAVVGMMSAAGVDNPFQQLVNEGIQLARQSMP